MSIALSACDVLAAGQLAHAAGETNIQRDPASGSFTLLHLGLERYSSDPTQFNPKLQLPIRSRPTSVPSHRQ